MSLKQTLSLLKDELDSHQIVVDFHITDDEQVIVSGISEADRLLGRSECRKRGIRLAENTQALFTARSR